MKFQTKTSEYELTKDNGYFTLKKLSINEGAESYVSAGREFSSKYANLNELNQLILPGIIQTSPIKNYEEVEKFIGEGKC